MIDLQSLYFLLTFYIKRKMVHRFRFALFIYLDNNLKDMLMHVIYSDKVFNIHIFQHIKFFTMI